LYYRTPRAAAKVAGTNPQLPEIINIAKDKGAWSPDALVEFILPDRSHWKADEAKD
jgi:hypothetical protein